MVQINTIYKYFIGGLLRIVASENMQIFTHKMAKNGVTIGEWMVLRSLHEAELKTPSEIADHIGFSRGAISKLVDKLSQKKLIIRMESGSDRRYQEIIMTEEAKDLVPRLIKLATEHDNHFFSCLSKKERDNLRQMLDKIVNSNNIKGVPTK